MIIELIGLPGVGKTILAGAMKAKGAVLVPLPSRMRLVFDASAFWFSSPILAYRLFIHIMMRAPHDVRYELFVNGFLGYAARYRRAHILSRAGAVVVIDQGFFQLAVSLGKFPSSFFEKFPRPDLLVVVEADVVVREARMAARGWAPRAEFGTDKRLSWQQHAETALSELCTALTGAVSVRRYDGTRDPGEGAKELLSSVAVHPRAVPVRDFVKVATALFAYGIARLARIFRRTPQVVVLMYHAIDRSGWKLSVTPEAFERQMSYLARKGWAVPLADVVSYVKGEKKLHAHAVAVTFDDGYRDLFTTVLPILERYKIHATVFVPSDLSVRTDPEDRLRLTEEELCMLAQSPFITIGSHAKTHRKFTEISSKEMRSEAQESADVLARILEKRPTFFAYPFGARSEDAERAVKDASYEAAFGITEGTIQSADNLFRLKRVQVDGTMSYLLFLLRLTSAVDWNRRIVDSLRTRMSV